MIMDALLPDVPRLRVTGHEDVTVQVSVMPDDLSAEVYTLEQKTCTIGLADMGVGKQLE